MLDYLRYRYAKIKMAAFVNGELPSHTRRFIARLVDTDARVYEEYIRHRQAKQELERTLPVLGRPEVRQLDTIWAGIQAQMNTPNINRRTVPPRQRYSLSYGLAVLLGVLALLLPLAFEGGHVKASAVAQQSVPETQEFNTPSEDIPPKQPTAVAMVANMASRATDIVANLQNTPAPHTPGQSSQ